MLYYDNPANVSQRDQPTSGSVTMPYFTRFNTCQKTSKTVFPVPNFCDLFLCFPVVIARWLLISNHLPWNPFTPFIGVIAVVIVINSN